MCGGADDLFGDDDDLGDAVSNAEELRQCFGLWRWPAKVALLVMLLAWCLGPDVFSSAKDEPAARVPGNHPPPAFASAARSPAVLPTVRRGRGGGGGRLKKGGRDGCLQHPGGKPPNAVL